MHPRCRSEIAKAALAGDVAVTINYRNAWPSLR